MASYKLTYFEARGGGEIVRLTFAAAGQPLKDERLSSEQWKDFRDKTPMKAMPVLTITKDGKDTIYCQSGSISKYVAKKFGLYGDNEEETLLIDEVFESIMDTIRDLYKAYSAATDELKQEGYKNFKEKSVPKLAEYFINRKKAFGKNGYIIGGKLTLADIAFFNFVDSVTRFGQPEIGDTEGVKEHFELVKSNEGIAAWLAKRPESKF